MKDSWIWAQWLLAGSYRAWPVISWLYVEEFYSTSLRGWAQNKQWLGRGPSWKDPDGAYSESIKRTEWPSPLCTWVQHLIQCGKPCDAYRCPVFLPEKWQLTLPGLGYGLCLLWQWWMDSRMSLASQVWNTRILKGQKCLEKQALSPSMTRSFHKKGIY